MPSCWKPSQSVADGGCRALCPTEVSSWLGSQGCAVRARAEGQSCVHPPSKPYHSRE